MVDYSYYSEVEKWRLYVSDSKENRMDSCVNVINKDLFKGDTPVPDGTYDPHMGTTDLSWLCSTCGNEKGKCPGHFGSVDLKYPIKSPLFREYIPKWLKVICFRCGRLLCKRNVKAPATKLLSEYMKYSKPIKKCPWDDCGEEHPTVIQDKYEKSVFYAEYEDVSGKINRVELFNHIISEIFEKVSDETVMKLGVPLTSSPKNFILWILRVPPNTMRPDIRRLGGNRSNNNDVTALMKNIVEINNSLPMQIPPVQEIINSWREGYFNLDMLCFEMIKGSTSTNNQVRLVAATNSKAPSSIASRLPKKTGRIRGNIMGKRVWLMGRSVITGDDTLRIDEIGVPISMAKTLQIPETVRKCNINRLKIFYMNGSKIYPGCSGIYLNGTNKLRNIDYFKESMPNYELQEGDTIMRDLIDGDFVGFNRQPSLLFGQISSLRVVITFDSNTLRLNVGSVAPFNADSKFSSGSQQVDA